MYEERFYRNISKPRDMICYEVKLKETDLFCCTKTDLRTSIEDRVIFYRHQLEAYIKYRPGFKESLAPVETDIFAPGIVREMIDASQAIGVGPMACVAGAISEYVGRDIAALSNEFIIENGGDICLKTDHERIMLIHAKDSPYSDKIGIRLKGRDTPYGVCTSSGTIGHSLSFGRADAACIVGDSALFADGLATYVGNIVKKKDDIPIAIEKGKGYAGISGILIIFGDNLGVWGDLEIIKV
jgi:uncharacterized protein